MATVIRPTAQDLGKTFADLVRAEPHVSEVWVSTGRDGFRVWAIVDAASLDDERRLYGLATVLYERFPVGEFQVHVLNQRRYAGDARVAIPRGATQIEF